MKFKYRIRGKANNSFILRGMLFTAGNEIDFAIGEGELEFVKDRVQIAEPIDLCEPPKPVLQTDNKPKGVKTNVVRTRATSSANKVKNREEV